MPPCSAWSNKLITAKDHASVQLNIGNLDENGVFNGTFATFAMAGKIRSMVGHEGTVASLKPELLCLCGSV